MSGSAILTNNGLLKIASASPLDQLTITQIAIGDGVNPLDPNSTALVNEVYRDAASTPIRSTTYPNTLVFELNIPPTTGGFTCREIGAFDTDGDLIAVGTLDELVKPTDGINYVARINVKLANADQVDVFYDNQGAIDHSGLRNRDADNVHTANAIEGLEFDTVAEAVAYSKIDKLVGRRVWIGERGAYFKVVLTSTVTPNGARYIQSTSNSSYSFSLIISESMTLNNFGCIGDDSTINDSFIESAVNSGVNELDTGKQNQLYRFNSISIPRDITWKGKGSLVGAALGTYPSISSMRSTNSNGRLALLQSYNPSSVVFTGTDGICGDLTIKRALITTSGSDSLEISENLNLVNCSMHNCYPYVYKQKAVLDAPLLIVSDSPDNGVKIERLGTAYMQFGRVYSPAVRGLNLVLSGFIDIQDGGVYDVLSGDSVLATQNSQIIMKRTEVKDGARVGVNLIYGSNADALDCVITGHEGAGLVCESNGSILAEGSTITGNGTNGTGAGVSTSYGGFIQCRYSTITGNGGPACENLTGGLIQAQGVIVDKSNNSGGFQFFSRAGGHILLDEMGDSNTPLLSNTDCHPTWGMIGAGGAFCGRDDNGIASRNGISVKRLYFGQRETQTISSGVITANDIYIQVANESSAATDNLDTITVDNNTPSEVMFISPANNGETLVIKHNTGNIISPDGLDVTLDTKNRVAMLVLNPSTIKWIVTKF